MMDRRILVPADAATGAPLTLSVTARKPEAAPLKFSAKLHPSAVALRQNVLAEALLEKTSARQRRRPADWVISVGIHLAVVGMLLAVPLFFTQAIDFKQLTATILVAPPAPPPPPAIVSVPPASHRPPKSLFQVGRLVAPAVAPRAIPPANQDAPSPEVNIASVSGGLPGGIPGGVPGGVLGGIPDGGTGLPASLAAPVANAPKAPVRVGGSVRRPRLVSAVQPAYPLLAKQAQVQGIVSIDAVIDVHGNVVEVQAISGSPLLIPAALQAVAQWKYEPTYLNGTPVSVELTVDVTFRFH